MSVAKGNIENRPYASIVYRLSAHQFSGRLRLIQDGREYWIRFNVGQIVDAHSPEATDSLTKMAAKTGIANKTQLAAVIAAKRKDPSTPDATLLQEVANLTAEQVAALERHRIAQSAARTFGLAGADFEATAEEPTSSPGVITTEWVILNGLRRYYDEQRLLVELGDLAGKRVRLAPGFADSAALFAFDESCAPVISALGTDFKSLKEVVLALPDVDRKLLLCVIYAIHATGLLALEGAAPAETAAPTTDEPSEEDILGMELVLPEELGAAPEAAAAPEPAPAAPEPAPAAPPAQAAQPTPPAKTAAPQQPTRAAPASASPAAAAQPDGAARVKVKRKSKVSAAELTELIVGRIAALDSGADHFALLGVSRSCSAAELQKAYFSLAKNLHPDRARAAGVEIPAEDIERLFATVNKAFTVLSDGKKRSHYVEVLSAGGELAYRRKQEEAEAMAMKILQAEEHFLAGEMALRRKDYKSALSFFEKAVADNPEEGEHHGYYGWAQWLAASDKEAAYKDANAALTTGAEKSPKSAAIRYFLGEIANQRGQHSDAARYFEETLKLDKKHNEAQLQLRLLKSRGLV